MAMRYIVFLSFITILFLPLRVFALGFSCCQCEAKTVNKNFCVLIPDAKSCDFAAQEIDKTTGEKYEISCSSLAMEACNKLKTNASAQCTNKPEAYDKINEAFLTNNSTGNQVFATATKPVLGVDIPGVDFPDKLEVKDNMIQIPYLAIYIIGLQKYLIGIGLIASAIIIIYGGILYIVAATGVKVSEGKEKIKDGILGLCIILGSTAILYNINPNTTQTGAMKVVVVGAQDTPEDPDAARAMVEESAKIRWNHELPGNTQLDFSDSGEVSKIYIPKEGTIATNKEGLPVAQGNCSPDMIAIKMSPAYKAKTKKEVTSFCIDRYEAPNRRGIKPYSGVLGIEAAWWCDRRGKRLCTVDEWQRACLGPEGKNTYGFGESYVPGSYVNKGPNIYPTKNPPAPCNYDSYNPNAAKLIKVRDKILGAFNNFYPQVPDGSILVPENQNSALMNEKYREAYYAAKQFLEEINTAVEVSGGRSISITNKTPSCVTEEGVVDMIGNVQEIALVKKKPLKELESLSSSSPNNSAFIWLNFYWSPIAHNANLNAKPTCTQVWGVGEEQHAVSWRAYENGFRCCMDLEDMPAEAVVETSSVTDDEENVE